MLSRGKEALVHTFLEAMRRGDLPWHQSWSTAPPRNIQTGKDYRGMNNLILSQTAAEKGYTDPRWMTLGQIREQGWQARPGETATRVEFWHYFDRQTGQVLDSAQLRRLQAERPERTKDIRLSAYTYTVFNAEQVTGVPRLDRPATRTDVSWLKESRDILLGNLGVGFHEGGDRASYLPGTDSIHMPPAKSFNSDYAYACTLLHELGHATGHYTRLNRPVENIPGTSAYAREELRAELASAFMAQELGLPMEEAQLAQSTDQHRAYLPSWIGTLEKDPGELFAAIADADRITDYLLEHGRVRELGMPTMETEAQPPEPACEEGWEM